MKKNIYIINQHYYPELASTGQVFQEIAEYFAGLDYKVTVIAGKAFYHDEKMIKPLPRELSGVIIVRLWNTAFKKSFFLGKAFNLLTFQASLALYSLFCLHRDSFVMVGTNPPLALLSLIIAKKIRCFKLISVIQDLYPDILVCSGFTNERAFLFRFLRRIVKNSFKACDRIVTISEDMRNHMEKIYTVAEVKVINNMVIGDIYPKPSVNNRNTFDTCKEFLVMYSGNFGIAHEYETLHETVRLLAENESILFKIVGGGIHYNSLKKACIRESLRNISFFPYTVKEDLNTSLNEADVHLIIFDNEFKNVLMPSKYYGILACGKPIILISSGENVISRDIVSYDIGFTVANNEPFRLRDILIKLSQEPETLIAMGQRARMLYMEKYRRELVLEKYKGIIDSFNLGQL